MDDSILDPIYARIEKLLTQVILPPLVYKFISGQHRLFHEFLTGQNPSQSLFGIGADRNQRGQRICCPANAAPIRHSRPDSGLDMSHFQAKVIETFQVFPFSLGSGFFAQGSLEVSAKTSNEKGST